MIRLVMILAILILLAPAGVHAEDGGSSGLRGDIERLMRASGAADMGSQLGQMLSAQLAASLRQANPGVPRRAGEIIAEVVGNATSAESAALVEELVPLYAHHFSQEEIRGLTAFYESPLGRKLVVELPDLMRESMDVGQSWVERLMPALQVELKQRLQAEGMLETGNSAEPPAS